MLFALRKNICMMFSKKTTRYPNSKWLFTQFLKIYCFNTSGEKAFKFFLTKKIIKVCLYPLYLFAEIHFYNLDFLLFLSWKLSPKKTFICPGYKQKRLDSRCNLSKKSWVESKNPIALTYMHMHVLYISIH